MLLGKLGSGVGNHPFSSLVRFILPLCRKPLLLMWFVAGTTGLEPATSAVTGQRSNQLSYVPKFILDSDYISSELLDLTGI
jgi:hypothetical protein